MKRRCKATRTKGKNLSVSQVIVPGKYLARLVRRQSEPYGRSECVELVFEVIDGRFKGVTVAGKFWHKSVVSRAKKIPPWHAAEVFVQEKKTPYGKTFLDVVSFCELGTANVVTFISGAGVNEAPGESDGLDGPPAMFTAATFGDMVEAWGPNDRDPHEIKPRKVEIEGEPTPYLREDVVQAFNLRIRDDNPPQASSGDDDEPHVFIQQAEALRNLAPLGLLTTGGKDRRRQIVDFDETFAGFCRLAPGFDPDVEAHLSVCQYTPDIATYQQNNEGSVAGYRGPAWSLWHAMDLDAAGGTDEEITQVLDQTRRVVKALVGNAVEREKVMCFFSGRRGFHVLFPSLVAETVPSKMFAASMGTLCQFVADQAERVLGPKPESRGERWLQMEPSWHAPLDWNVYKPLAMLRAPNTRHPETRLYKVRLAHDELFSLDVAAIRELARSPRPFELPSWHHATWIHWDQIWAYCVAVAGQADRRSAELSIDPAGWVHTATFEFMVFGADEGTRATRLFQAAKNLLEIGCSRSATEKLLAPAAHMAGLTSDEVRTQINGAARWFKRPREIENRP
jgi:hypothetical protein